MTVELLLSPMATENELVFEIERGDIGYTQVEFFRFSGTNWEVMKTVQWAGKSGDGVNLYSVEIPIAELIEIAPTTIVDSQQEDTSKIDNSKNIQGTEEYPWWNDSVFYEIFVRSFYDSDGDGIGDFNGIVEKMDYLNDGNPNTSTDLGITGIWLMPINPSPSYHGYSVTDYYSVNPEYGTMDDFENFLNEAHKRGIKAIVDLVLNHTSNQHPWFLNAADPTSPYHDWYIWSDTDPGYVGSWGQEVWFEQGDEYYYSTFSEFMPDLNYTNPEVTQEMQNVVQFWVNEVGVDGFRLDAAKHLIEEGTKQANTISTHSWYEKFRPALKQINPHALVVGEIWEDTRINAEYLQGDELDLSFEFYLADAFIKAVNNENSSIAKTQMEISYGLIPSLQYATFLTNHDQDRLLSQMYNDPQKAILAGALLLTSPGVPFIYYGEEIGMEGQKPDEQIRSPMQWSAERNAGFTTGSPWQAIGPDWELYNVANEVTDPESILSNYRTLIHARNQHPALRVGDLYAISTGNQVLYSILRVSEEETVLVLINLSGDPVTDYRLSLEASNLPEGNYVPASILGGGDFMPLEINSNGGFSRYTPILEVPPYAIIILGF